MSSQAQNTKAKEIFAQKGQAAPSVERAETAVSKKPPKQSDLPFRQESEPANPAPEEPPPAGSLLSIDFRRLTDSERGQILSLRANKAPSNGASDGKQPPLPFPADFRAERLDRRKRSKAHASVAGTEGDAALPKWQKLKKSRDKEAAATSETTADQPATDKDADHGSLHATGASEELLEKTPPLDDLESGESSPAAPNVEPVAVPLPATSDDTALPSPPAEANVQQPALADSAGLTKPVTTGPRPRIGLAAMIGFALLAGLGLWAMLQSGDEPKAPDPEAVAATKPASPATDALAAKREAQATANGAVADQPQSEVVPSFDLIRIEPTGEAVLAGRAPPRSSLIILDNGAPLGTVTADSVGEWAFIPDQPLPPGDHAFALVISTPQGEVVLPAQKELQQTAPATQEPASAPSRETPAAAEAPAVEGTPAAQPGAGQETDATGEDPPLPVAKPAPQHSALTGIKRYGVQLSSTTSEQAALREWQSLRARFPGLLGDKKLDVQKAVLQDGVTRYRVRTSLAGEPRAARKLCDALRAQNQDCLVFRD